MGLGTLFGAATIFRRESRSFCDARDTRLGDSIKLDFSIYMLLPQPEVYRVRCSCPPEEGEVTCLPSVGWCHKSDGFFAVYTPEH